MGTLSTTDSDSGDSHTYTLVSGTGDTDNGNFNISGSTLRTNGALAANTYSIRVNTNDGTGDFAKSINVTISDDIPPIFENSTPSVSNLEDLFFNLDVDIDEAGTVYYVIVADGATAPTSAEVKAGTASGGGSALFSGNKAFTTAAGFFDVAVLTPSTAYDVYVVAEDDEGSPNLQASPTKIDVTTPEASLNYRWTSATAPSAGVVAETVNGITATVTTNTTSSVISNNAAIDNLIGTKYNTVAANSPSTTTMTVTFSSSIDLTSIQLGNFSGLADWVLTPTGGSNSVVTVSSFNALTSRVASLNWEDVTSFTITVSGGASASFIIDEIVVPVPDLTAPSFENSTPSSSSITQTGFTLGTDIDEAGTIYYVVVPDGASAPSSAQVKAGTDASNGSPIANASQAVSTGGFTHDFSVTGLTAGTAYDVYVVAEDDEDTPNLQASPTKIDVTTASAPTVAFNTTTSSGAESVSSADLTVSLSTSSTQTVTVGYSVTGGTATGSGTDYTLASGTLTFTPGDTSETITISSIVDDAIVEANETVIVTLSSPSNATLGTNTAHTYTINNNDAAAVTIADVEVNENSGTATITLVLDNAVDGGFSVEASTQDGTATTADSDYTAVSGETIMFDGTSGEMETFTVTLGADTKVEANETVSISMDGLSVSTVSSGNIDVTDIATLTLNNDDNATVTIADVSGNEDDGAITLTATLNNAVDGGFEVNVSTADGTATTANSDYTSVTNFTLTFSGVAGETQTFDVTPTTDAITESNEALTVSMSNVVPNTVSASDIDITDGATVTILDDDIITPTITFDDINKTYGDANFNLSASSDSPGAISYSIIGAANGTSLSGTNNATVNIGNAGSVTIRATQAASGQYESGTSDITLTIGKANLIVTADNQTRNYGDANPTLTVSYLGFQNGDDASVIDSAPSTSTTADTTTGVGTPSITVSGGLDDNYTFTPIAGTLTISPRPITVSVDLGQAKVFGTSDPASFTFSITVGNLVNGDTPTGALTRTAGDFPGTFPIMQGTLDYGSNYNVTFVGVDFTIAFVLTTGTAATSSFAATVTGESTGEGTILERGVVYSTTDNTPEIGEPNVIKVVDDSTTGPFEVTIPNLDPNTSYFFQTYLITNTSSSNGDGSGSIQIAEETFYGGVDSFATATVEPNATAFSPLDGATLVDPTTNLVISFDQNVQKGSGNIEIRRDSDNSLVESIDVNTANVTVSGSTVTINPVSDLPQLTNVHLIIPIGVIENTSSDNWTGLVAASEWNFQTDDTVAPIVIALSPMDDAVDVPVTSDLTVTFNENVVKGTGNIVVRNSSDDSVIATLDVASSEVSITGNVVTINPATDLPSETTMYIEVASGVFEDEFDNVYAGVAGNAAWNFTTEDITPPTVTLSTTAGSPSNTDFTATITFSEPVNGFDLTDIDVTNGIKSIFNQIDATTYTVRIAPAGHGPATVSIAAGALQDTSSNANDNLASNVLNFEFDLVLPTVLITSNASNPTNLSSFTVTFIASEDLASFEEGDLNIVNATISDFTTVNDALFTATITPTIEGNITIDLLADTVEDNANNGNVAASYSIMYDATNPTVVISSTAADPIDGVFTATFTFSEDVTGFEMADITLTNGTASDFTATSASVYTALITPMADGNVTIDVAADVAQDAATNGNDAATQFSILHDGTNPTVTITSDAPNPTNAAFTATFTFSEDVTGFDMADITPTNATVSNFNATSASVYTATITPAADGDVMIDVAADVAQDAATNGNDAATQYSVLYDSTNPVVTITSGAPNPTNAAFTATFTFSEDVTGFEMADIAVTNGTPSNFAATSGSVYTATITPAADGSVIIDVAADVAQDAATNGNDAATQFTIEHDATRPTVVVSSSVADPTNAAFDVTITFSEDVTGFEMADITPTNATVSNFNATSGSVYTATITPASDGTVSITVPEDTAQDAASNGNEASNTFSAAYDATRPVPTITSTVANPTNAAFDVTITFTEDVTGFEMADITVTNGTPSNFVATNATTYSATITPTADGPVFVDVTEDVAQDAATNGNTSTSFEIEYDSTPPVTPQITHISDYTCSGNVEMTGDNTLEISGVAEAGSTVEVFQGGTSIGTTTATADGFFTFDHTGTTLADDSYVFTAQATDIANNTGALSAPFAIIVNTVDVDNDGIADFCDDDLDNDGTNDDEQDCDGDGIPDSLDTDNSSCSNSILTTRSYGFSPNGDGINDGWTIENITAFPNNVVSVYSRSGKLVFRQRGYQNDWTGVSNQINSNNGTRLPVGPYIFLIDLGNGSTPVRGWLYINY